MLSSSNNIDGPKQTQRRDEHEKSVPGFFIHIFAVPTKCCGMQVNSILNVSSSVSSRHTKMGYLTLCSVKWL